MSRHIPHPVFRFFLLLFGVMCGSTAVILIKASDEHPFLVASYRLLLASAILFPFFLRDLRDYPGYGWRQLSWTFLPAAALAVHFMSWVVGARMTPVANASLIANLTPVAMPFFVWLFFQERVNRVEIFGTFLTLTGLILLTGFTFRINPEHFRGNLICFGSMLAFAAYLALGRRNGGRISLWLYMVPLYFFAGLISLITATFWINPLKPYTLSNILYILALAIVPTVGGHTILNYSLKFFRGQVVSVTNLTQPIFATILGYLVFQEKPAPLFYLAAGIMMIGILIVLQGSRLHQVTR
ncbi:DMT family transporter [Anaerolinea sp.]|uniref:DMT family transporter n=1 Tax=Anaerolinea sp. TaxID=1872519 RepID=UPI002632416D|nr:DMT family transporter [uncultured Anaerolinea sp.]